MGLAQGLENLGDIQLPMDPNEKAPLFAFVANAAASSAGQAVVATVNAAKDGIGKAASAPNRIEEAMNGVSPKNTPNVESQSTPRSKETPELVQAPNLPEHAQSAAHSVGQKIQEHLGGPQEGVHVAASEVAEVAANASKQVAMSQAMARNTEQLSI